MAFIFYENLFVDKQSYHLSNSKVTFLQPEQKKETVIILNERGLESRKLP